MSPPGALGRVVPFVKLKRETRSVSRSSTLAIQLSRRWMIRHPPHLFQPTEPRISPAGPRAKTRDSPLELALASSEPQPKSVAPAPSSGPTTGSPSRLPLARCARSLLTAAARASCRLSDGRVQDVWSVTVYVRSVLVTSTVGLSKRCTRFRCPSSLTQSSARPAKQEEPSGKKISIGSENR